MSERDEMREGWAIWEREMTGWMSLKEHDKLEDALQAKGRVRAGCVGGWACVLCAVRGRCRREGGL